MMIAKPLFDLVREVLSHARAIAAPFLCALLVAGCTVYSGARDRSASLYDLGPLPAQEAGAPAVAVSVADPVPAAWLDTQMMYYRLDYADRQAPQTYAHNRWAMQPAQLVGQRIKARIAAAGGVAAPAAQSATNLPTLHVELDEFTHEFASPDKSHGRVALRASLFAGRTLLAQKSFTATAPAPQHDAAGGARALAVATDTVVGELIDWLSRAPRKP